MGQRMGSDSSSKERTRTGAVALLSLFSAADGVEGEDGEESRWKLGIVFACLAHQPGCAGSHKERWRLEIPAEVPRRFSHTNHCSRF